jgi:hypothetical protein
MYITIDTSLSRRGDARDEHSSSRLTACISMPLESHTITLAALHASMFGTIPTSRRAASRD